MTKIITVTCLMQLVERGQIGLDDDIKPLVPELAAAQILKGFDEAADGAPILQDNPHPITLRHLLTHTAGLGYDVADPDLQRWSQHVGRTKTIVSSTIEGFTTPLKFVPGEGWYYGTATDWAGQVLERVTGLKLGEYMAENVFAPLGMVDSGFVLGSVLGGEGARERYVEFCERHGETGELGSREAMFPPDPAVESGGGGLYSTLGDYGKVVQALLRALAGEEGGLVSQATAETMFTPQLDDAQRGWLTSILNLAGFVPEFPAGTPVDHGIGGCINTEDVPGKRKKGSMKWGGMCNSHWVRWLPAFMKIYFADMWCVRSGWTVKPESEGSCSPTCSRSGMRLSTGCTTSWSPLSMQSCSRVW